MCSLSESLAFAKQQKIVWQAHSKNKVHIKGKITYPIAQWTHQHIQVSNFTSFFHFVLYM